MTILLNAVLTAESVARSSVPFCSLLHSSASRMQPTDICSGSVSMGLSGTLCLYERKIQNPRKCLSREGSRCHCVPLESTVRGGGWLTS